MGAWNFTWKKRSDAMRMRKKSSAARAFLRFFLLLQTTTTGGKNIKNKEEVYACGLHPFTREKTPKSLLGERKTTGCQSSSRGWWWWCPVNDTFICIIISVVVSPPLKKRTFEMTLPPERFWKENSFFFSFNNFEKVGAGCYWWLHDRWAHPNRRPR